MGILNDRFTNVGRGGSLRVLDFCSFTWVFDEQSRWFRRVPRGAALDVPAPRDAWISYDRLDLNEERGSFAVFADREGTHVFRCWLHRDPCPRCQHAEDEGLDMDEMRWLIQRWKSRLGIPEGYHRPVLVPAPLPAVSPLVQGRRHRDFSRGNMSPTTGAMFKLRNEQGVVIIEAYGQIDAEEAGQLRDLALLAVVNNQAVVIDLEQVKSLTAEAAGALLFRGEGTRFPKGAITVRTGGRPARTAVLEAYAHRRGRRAQA